LNNTTISHQLEVFFTDCKTSSERAIAALTALVQVIENPETQKEGILLLKSILEYTSLTSEEETRKLYHFHFFEMEIPKGLNEVLKIKLLQLPSTFAPEEWSFTFFEGLSRYPISEFQNKKMVELGCGNGWITLSIALKFNCAKIYGLDINPKAIISSKLNLYLNAFDQDGDLIILDDGSNLLDKVEFKESDLLSCFYKKNPPKFDSIIGCIPQVLAPQESIDNSKINHQANDEFLHSLSNYTSEQGYVEDKFGLGLIARSVEESIDFLNPDGKLILNLGERPRREVLEQLVKRRGLLINRIWMRKVAQANDTDIDSLVRLEREMNHHFEFYTDIHSETPINARTAKLYASKGGKIFHNLSVYECKFDFYTETKLLFDELKNELFSEAKTSLDLDYENSFKKEEKIRFLAELVKVLRQTSHFPYEDSQGEVEFRKSLAHFLKAYQHVNLTEDNIFIAPNLETLVENVIDIYKPKSIFLSEGLFSFFSQSANNEHVVCIPNAFNELISLISTIQPQIVVYKITENTIPTKESFQKIIETCNDSKSRLFVDISDCFDLSSTPKSNGFFQFLSGHEMPIHVSLICELSKNQIYNDLKTCFVISSNQTLIDYLKNTAEFSYSRSPYLSQLFYTILIKELTNFHMKSPSLTICEHKLSYEDLTFQSNFVSLPENVAKSFLHAAIQGNELKIDKETVRLDYGENELACPDDLKISILESFTQKHFSIEESDPKKQIQHFVFHRFGISNTGYIFYGNGVAPLFAGIIKIIKEENGTLIIPQGSYGYFYATAEFYGVPIQTIPTRKSNKFCIEKSDLENTLKDVENPWLFLNFPLVNPTGAFLNDDQVKSLLEAKGIDKTKIIIDTVFSGLEFQGVQKSTVFSNTDLKFVLLGGISKEYSAGGIRFGFAMSNFSIELDKKVLFTPHSTVKNTIKKILLKYNHDDDRVKASLKSQVLLLQERANRLSSLLSKNGWDVLPPEGGLFLIASPASLIGKKYCLLSSNQELIIDATTISRVFHDAINVLINNDEWTGIPSYCRFVLSVKDEVFEESLKRIEKFHLEF
jgi:methionine S-methyltransferase